MEKPLCLNFRLITAQFSGVRKFRNFTVASVAALTGLYLITLKAKNHFSGDTPHNELTHKSHNILSSCLSIVQSYAKNLELNNCANV